MKNTTSRVLSLTLLAMLAAAGCTPAVTDEGLGEEVDESSTAELSNDVDPTELQQTWRSQSAAEGQWKYLELKTNYTFNGVMNLRRTQGDDARVTGTFTASTPIFPRVDGQDYDVLLRLQIVTTDTTIRHLTKFYAVKYDNGWTGDAATLQQVTTESNRLRAIGDAQTMNDCWSCSMADYDHRFRFTPTRVLVKEFVLPDSHQAGTSGALPDPNIYVKGTYLGGCVDRRDCTGTYAGILLTSSELRDGVSLEVYDNNPGIAADGSLGSTSMRIATRFLGVADAQSLYYPGFGQVEQIWFTLDRL